VLGESRQTDPYERAVTSDTKGKSVNIPILGGLSTKRKVLQGGLNRPRDCKVASQAEDLFAGIQKSFLFSLSTSPSFAQRARPRQKGSAALKELGLGNELLSEEALFRCKGRKISQSFCGHSGKDNMENSVERIEAAGLPFQSTNRTRNRIRFSFSTKTGLIKQSEQGKSAK